MSFWPALGTGALGSFLGTLPLFAFFYRLGRRHERIQQQDEA
jgi:membrane protein DedA with SNARE-associated domain